MELDAYAGKRSCVACQVFKGALPILKLVKH